MENDKKETLEKLSKMYDSMRDMVTQYNKLAKEQNAPTRVGMMFRDVQEECEEQLDEGEEIDDSFNYQQYVNNYYDNIICYVYTPEASNWFPSNC